MRRPQSTSRERLQRSPKGNPLRGTPRKRRRLLGECRMPKEVLVMTATFQKDGSWWNGYFLDSELMQKFGPYKDQQAAVADGPRVAKILRECTAKGGLRTRELSGVSFPWYPPNAKQ
jgi:hypothetical protein